MATVYEINKGVNKPLEFRGLKAQYVTYLAVGLVILLLLFVTAYIAGVSAYLLLPTVFVLGIGLFSWVYRWSNKYGEHGLMKEAAFRSIPAAIFCRSRHFFLFQTQS